MTTKLKMNERKSNWLNSNGIWTRKIDDTTYEVQLSQLFEAKSVLKDLKMRDERKFNDMERRRVKNYNYKISA
jgi:hypothetical protein